MNSFKDPNSILNPFSFLRMINIEEKDVKLNEQAIHNEVFLSINQNDQRHENLGIFSNHNNSKLNFFSKKKTYKNLINIYFLDSIFEKEEILEFIDNKNINNILLSSENVKKTKRLKKKIIDFVQKKTNPTKFEKKMKKKIKKMIPSYMFKKTGKIKKKCANISQYKEKKLSKEKQIHAKDNDDLDRSYIAHSYKDFQSIIAYLDRFEWFNSAAFQNKQLPSIYFNILILILY